MSVVNRREVLAAGGPWALLTLVAGFAPARAAPPPSPRFGEPQPFSFDNLRARAKALAASPYVAPAPSPKVVDTVDFDAVQAIKFRADRALWPDGPGACPVRLFHVDKYNPLGVRINELSNGQARELIYSPDCFDYKDAELADTAARRPRFLRIPRHGRPRQGDGLARLPGCQLLSHVRRGEPVRRVGARHRRQHRHADEPSRSFRASSSSGSTSRMRIRSRSRSMRCSMARASAAPIASMP